MPLEVVWQREPRNWRQSHVLVDMGMGNHNNHWGNYSMQITMRGKIITIVLTGMPESIAMLYMSLLLLRGYLH